MWLDKIIEAKQNKKLSTKAISERTASNIPVDTINRILTKKTKTPRIDTVLEIGEAVGLSASELFAETTAVVSDSNTSAMQAEIDALKAESDALRVEGELLRAEIERLTAENLLLKEKNEKLRDKNDTLKDNIIATLCHYIKLEKED